MLGILVLIILLVAIILGAIRGEWRASPYWFYIAFGIAALALVGIPHVVAAS